MTAPASDDSAEVRLDGFPIPADADRAASRETLEVLMSRYVHEVRSGGQPSLDEYAARHPEFADDIRELFPLAVSLERWKVDKEVECVRRNLPEEFDIERLGEYRIVRELGRGGMGVVFEAVEDRTGRAVAIKLLPWRFVSDLPRRKERFHREAATIARLRHANIVPVYAFGEHDGYCYYVMQLVHGVSLDWIIRWLKETSRSVPVDEIRKGGRLSVRASERTEAARRAATRGLRRDAWASFAKIISQAASALDSAHQNDVVHNDVKPANLLLDGTGRVVVTDFGAGAQPEAGLTDTDECFTGTLRYMSPERLDGPGDARGDVYALGATLYELITLTPVFDSADRRKLAELVHRCEPAAPRTIVPQIPKPLEAIVLKAMARDPEARYPTARALAADLSRFVSGTRVEALGPTLFQRLMGQYRRRFPIGPRTTRGER